MTKTRFSEKFLNQQEAEYFIKKIKEHKILQRQIAEDLGLDISAVGLSYRRNMFPRYYLKLIRILELEKENQELKEKLSSVKNSFDNFVDTIKKID